MAFSGFKIASFFSPLNVDKSLSISGLGVTISAAHECCFPRCLASFTGFPFPFYAPSLFAPLRPGAVVAGKSLECVSDAREGAGRLREQVTQ